MFEIMLTLIIKPMVISLAGLALYRNCQRQSAAYRYFILSWLFVLLALSLLLAIIFPSWQLDLQFDPNSIWLNTAANCSNNGRCLFIFISA